MSLPKPRLLALAVALTAALVTLSFATSTSLAANPYLGNPPKFALIKGDTMIQKGRKSSTCWYHWKEVEGRDREAKGREAEGVWLGYCGDVFVDKKKDAYPRRAVPVPAGSTLHIRLYKPQRPDRVQLVEGFDENARSVFGWGRPLDNSLRPVERDGKTVAWDVFFRVKGPDRHYYLGIWVSWERVPGTHISYGDRGWGFHVRTL